MGNISIKAAGIHPSGVTVADESGVEISGITSVDIRVRLNDVVTATIGMAASAIDVDAIAILDLDTTRESAKRHGYRLIKILPTRQGRKHESRS